MKKGFYVSITIVFLLGILYGCFWNASPNTKLKLYTLAQKKWMRIRLSKPSVFLNESLLKQKLLEKPPMWMQAQIKEDLSHFSQITQASIDKCFSTHNTPHNQLVRIKIKNHTLSMQAQDPSLTNLKSYQIIHNVLTFLAKQHYLPDTDFILSLQDYVIPNDTAGRSRNSTDPRNEPLPIFTFAKDLNVAIEKHLILIPDWMNLRSRAEISDRIQYANTLFPWEQKIPLVFWRGGVADSTGFRHQLVSMTNAYPTAINAAFSQHDPALYVSEENHVPFRYQITIDGSRGTWERLVWQLETNCLVFKHNSQHVQWFYKGIFPNVHYVTIQDSDSLLSKMAWAEKNPAAVQTIVTQAMKFAAENLSLEDMYYYWILVIRAYSQKLI